MVVLVVSKQIAHASQSTIALPGRGGLRRHRSSIIVMVSVLAESTSVEDSSRVAPRVFAEEAETTRNFLFRVFRGTTFGRKFASTLVESS